MARLCDWFWVAEQSVKACLHDCRRWAMALAPCVLLLASYATTPSRVDKPILRNTSADVHAESIQEAVDEALQNVKIAGQNE